MVVLGQNRLYSGKVVELGKVVVLRESGCIQAKNCCIRAKLLYSGKSDCIRAKMVAFGQKCCIREKVVVFRQK